MKETSLFICFLLWFCFISIDSQCEMIPGYHPLTIHSPGLAWLPSQKAAVPISQMPYLWLSDLRGLSGPEVPILLPVRPRPYCPLPVPTVEW